VQELEASAARLSPTTLLQLAMRSGPVEHQKFDGRARLRSLQSWESCHTIAEGLWPKASRYLTDHTMEAFLLDVQHDHSCFASRKAWRVCCSGLMWSLQKDARMLGGCRAERAALHPFSWTLYLLRLALQSQIFRLPVSYVTVWAWQRCCQGHRWSYAHAQRIQHRLHQTMP
jgi:hypothetical protein